MNRLSLALATYNEETNILDCIQSCKGLVDEIVVVDGSSTDKTAELALEAGATVIRTQNTPMFHLNKQKAIDACSGEWILQLDADERVTRELAEEIKRVISMTNEEIGDYQNNLKEKKLFERHQRLVAQHATCNMQHETSNTHHEKNATCHMLHVTCEYNAFFIPRLNYFLGGYLRSGGVYPDGVIRLFRKGKAHLPCKDVHELMEVKGKTGWLENPLIHRDSPTFKRYLERNSRYIDRLVVELKAQSSKFKAEKKGFWLLLFSFQLIQCLNWALIKPSATFFSLFFLHRGYRDGWRGAVFAFFSAIRFARAFYRFIARSKG